MQNDKINTQAITTDSTTEKLFIPTSQPAPHTGRKLSPSKDTFTLGDGSYAGTIAAAFAYNDEKIMLKIQIPNDKTFINVTDWNHINQYPYSQLIMESGAEYLEQLVGLNISFTIKNNTSASGMPFSNIKRITLKK